MSEQKNDSRKKSASEAFVNSFGGYPIGYGVGIIILPLSMGWIQEDPLVANLVITFVYAIVSLFNVSIPLLIFFILIFLRIFIICSLLILYLILGNS